MYDIEWQTKHTSNHIDEHSTYKKQLVIEKWYGG